MRLVIEVPSAPPLLCGLMKAKPFHGLCMTITERNDKASCVSALFLPDSLRILVRGGYVG
jgi:hypothetical protein